MCVRSVCVSVCMRAFVRDVTTSTCAQLIKSLLTESLTSSQVPWNHHSDLTD